jgi:serine/threonine protein kinase HipA of HipAB toxin-antitoxin module
MMNEIEKEELQPNIYTCSEYREEMILAVLKKRIAQQGLSDKERASIEKEIHRIEKVLGF